MPLMREFLTTGRLGEIEPGASIDRVRDVLGPPDDESVSRRPVYQLRYGAVQFGLVPVPPTDDYRLATVAIYFAQPGRAVPAALRFTDWLPTANATEADVRRFAADAGLHPEPDAAWRGENVMFASGATATFDEGRLHSVHFHRRDKPADRKQLTVALPTETVNLLRQRARDEKVTIPDLLDRLIKTDA